MKFIFSLILLLSQLTADCDIYYKQYEKYNQKANDLGDGQVAKKYFYQFAIIHQNNFIMCKQKETETLLNKINNMINTQSEALTKINEQNIKLNIKLKQTIKSNIKQNNINESDLGGTGY